MDLQRIPAMQRLCPLCGAAIPFNGECVHCRNILTAETLVALLICLVIAAMVFAYWLSE